MTMLRWLGNAAEENNFKNISCPRDVPALLRHQRPEIAEECGSVCVCVCLYCICIPWFAINISLCLFISIFFIVVNLLLPHFI